MSKLQPLFALKKSGESVNDLNFWSKYQEINEFTDYLLLAAYGGNAGIDVWDLKTRRPTFHIDCETAKGFLSVASVNASDIVSLSKEGCLQSYQVTESSIECRAKLYIGDVGFCKASVSSMHEDKTCLVAVPGGSTSLIHIWDIHEQTIISRLLVPETLKVGMVMCLKLLAKEKIIVAGYEDGSIICWDIFQRTILFCAKRLFTEPVMGLDAIVVRNESEIFVHGVASSAKEEVIKWKGCLHVDRIESPSNNFTVLKTISLLNAGVSCVSIRHDKKIFATGGWDNTVRLFSWKTAKPLAVLNYHNESIRTLTFAANILSSNQVMACGSSDKKITIWKVYND